MNVLLDECLPRPLKLGLSEFQVRTVPECGWAGKKNGELLSCAETEFDVFITIDKNLEYQQVLARFRLAVITLDAVSNTSEVILRFTPLIREALLSIAPGKVIRLSL